MPAHAPTPTRPFPVLAPARAALAAVALAALTACGGGGGDPGSPTLPPPSSPPPLACVVLPEIVWHRSELGSADWNDLAIDAQNRIWLAGYTDGRLGTGRTDPDGDARAVVRQLSPRGELLWDSGALFDTPGTDVAEAVALSPGGTVAVAGRTSGSIDGRPNAGQFDSFVAWSDAPATGWRRWQTGTPAPQHPRRLSWAGEGELRLAGYDDEFVPSNYVEAWTDPFVLALQRADAGTGAERITQRWSHQFATAEPDLLDGLAVTSDGATFVSGISISGARRGMFVRKLDRDGQALWTARYGNVAVDNIAALRVLPDGSLLMAGSVFGSFRGGEARGQQDVFVARIHADDGRVLWSTQFGSADADWLTDLQVDGSGRIVLLGETAGSFVTGQPNAGQHDLFMLKLDAAGQLLAARQWGTGGDEGARRLALDSCGRALAVGSSTAQGRRAGVLWMPAL